MLPWQHLRLMRIVIMCKVTPIDVRLNLKNFTIIYKSPREAESALPSPGEIGLSYKCRKQLKLND